MSRDGGDRSRRGLAMVAVLVLQLVIAAVFIVLVATDSLPLPGAAAAPHWPMAPRAS